MFPSAVTQTGADGQPKTSIQPDKDGSDVQSNFFDMWRQEHPEADLQDVPGDLVMASGSGPPFGAVERLTAGARLYLPGSKSGCIFRLWKRS